MHDITTADLLSDFTKEYGSSIIRDGPDDPDRLPFGIFALDVALGGGVPEGRVTILYGPEGAGKTNHAMCLIREHQKRHPDQFSAIMDIENTLDRKWMEAFGIDLDRVYLIQPDTAEQAVDMTEKLLLAEDMGLVVFDSIAMLMQAAELDRSAEVANVGGAGLVINKLTRKINNSLKVAGKNDHHPTVVFVNQIRQKIGVVHGSDEIMPGGKAPLFLASCIIRFGGRGEKDSKVHPTMPAYQTTRAGIKKTKFEYVNPNAEYKMALIRHGDILVGRTRDFPAVKHYAQELGILTKCKAGWSFMGDEYKTLDEVWEALRSNTKAFDTFKSVVVKSMLPEDQADPALATKKKTKKKLTFKKKAKKK